MRHQVRRPPPAEPAGDYQLSEAASKGNPFCWKTWKPDPAWLPGAPEGRGRFGDGDAISRTQTARIENLRALGIDPLHLPGMGRQTTDVARTALLMPRVRN